MSLDDIKNRGNRIERDIIIANFKRTIVEIMRERLNAIKILVTHPAFNTDNIVRIQFDTALQSALFTIPDTEKAASGMYSGKDMLFAAQLINAEISAYEFLLGRLKLISDDLRFTIHSDVEVMGERLLPRHLDIAIVLETIDNLDRDLEVI